jgi:hypothetical protein
VLPFLGLLELVLLTRALADFTLELVQDGVAIIHARYLLAALIASARGLQRLASHWFVAIACVRGNQFAPRGGLGGGGAGFGRRHVRPVREEEGAKGGTSGE